jgi:multimeric flavodoxin WrbA
MKVLGISASCRKWGNTDILVHHALKGVSSEGAEIRFLRLTDLEIRQCTGCFTCLAKEVDCVQGDQFPELLAAMRWADGVVLGAPVYTLCAAGSVQKMIPRFFRSHYTGEFEGKPGLALVATGGEGFDGLARPQVSLFFLFAGMPVIDQIVGFGQGPGEVFYHEEACQGALKGGEAMARGETEFQGEPGICPSCHFSLVQTRQDGSAHCVLCDLSGRWASIGETKRFEPDPDEESRFSPGWMRRHFERDILTSVARFRERAEEIRERVKRLKQSSTCEP